MELARVLSLHPGRRCFLGGQLEQLLTSHPALAQRLAAADAVLVELPPAELGPPREPVKSFAAALAVGEARMASDPRFPVYVGEAELSAVFSHLRGGSRFLPCPVAPGRGALAGFVLLGEGSVSFYRPADGAWFQFHSWEQAASQAAELLAALLPGAR